MNRQLYEMGGIGSLQNRPEPESKQSQITRAYVDLLKMGLSEDEARQSIQTKLAELSELNNKDNLLKPGEYAGENYKGSPDMYPDYEIDSQENNNRQMRQMGGVSGISGMGMQDEQSMQSSPQQMQDPLQNQGQPQMDPNQAIEILVRMLMEQGIPQEEAVKIAMQMIQAVSEGGMQEVSDDTRIEARFGGRIGYAGGGISRLVDREQYGFGSFFKGVTKAVKGVVKGVTKAVKKVASSDLGKIALAAAAIYAGGGGALFGGPGFASPGTLFGAGGTLGGSTGLLGTSAMYGPPSAGLLGVGGSFAPFSGSLFSGGISSLLPGKGSLISAGAGFLGGALAGGMQPPQQEPGESLEDYQRRVAEFQRQYQSNLAGTTGASLRASANNPYYPVYAANGGRIGYQEGGIGNVITQATQEAFFGQPQMPMMANGGRMNYSKGSDDKSVPISGDEFQKILEEFMKNQEKQEKIRRENKYNGGRMGYAMGNSVQQGIMAAPQIANQMGMPVGTPRMNEGGVPELDYRDEGGFVPPIGIKERADDIPAMLSNNEFVFTADAVKNADPEGEKDPERGAREMYVLMKRLESGGMV
jgi:hypothetical protein